MKHLFYPLASGLFLLAACNKDAPEADRMVLTGDYQAGATLAAGPITLYTQNGPVTTPAVVDRYLARQPWAASTFSRTDAPISPTNTLTVLIRPNNQVYLISTKTASGRRDTIKHDLTAQNSAYAVLAGRDSVSTLTTSSSTAVSRCALLAGQMEKELPVKRCVAVPIATGFSQQCKFRPIRLLKIDAGQLAIPQLGWLAQSGQPLAGTCGRAAGGAWNVFNTAVLNQLTAGDTLVVQERTIALTKK
ncbi:hypothetical protein [Hymenobacter ruricola]|uniref:Uncharacterized protein n=1 Tax=Hymenobacter ruricola TaxID=2791023 RepID=A0ABS0I5C6_9BACT|nr:hypothetical protein [Hymenobacter ruricola]MBF9222094.1 hypothetical protein [Hymenobacter ruricola]